MTRPRTRRRPTAMLLAPLLALAVVAVAARGLPPKAVAKERVKLQLLAINDFHGQITPYSPKLGGAACLSTYFDVREAAAEADNALTWRLGVGDLIGASPAASAFLQDEPTMQALDQMDFRYSTVGNHEFDEGLTELYRLQYGGYSNVTGDWPGTKMQYLAANVINEYTGDPIFRPYVIENARGVKVGIIGVVSQETPSVATASSVKGLKFLDESDTVNVYVDKLMAEGVETIIVLMHHGRTSAGTGVSVTGDDFISEVEAIDDEVDVVLSAHSHNRYRGYVGGKLVTQAHSAGRAFADIDLVLDRETGDVVSKTAEIVRTDISVDSPPDPEIQAIVDAASVEVAPIVSRPIGAAAEDISRTQNAAGESELGNLLADGQRWRMNTQLAFMNPAGIRATLSQGQVTYGDLFAVQPFGHYMVSMRLTGEQIDALLEEQWRPPGTRMLQISGLTYSWSVAAPVGSKIDIANVMVGDVPIDPAATYRVAANIFLSEGGDGFSTFKLATDRVYGVSDLDALVDYVEQRRQPFNSVLDGRISVLP